MDELDKLEIYANNDEIIVDLMKQLKQMKAQFGFMEYFYAGILFSQNISKFQSKYDGENKEESFENEEIDILIQEILSAKIWAKRMDLNSKQKTLYFYSQFISDKSWKINQNGWMRAPPKMK